LIGGAGNQEYYIAFYGVDSAWVDLVTRVVTLGTGTPQGSLPQATTFTGFAQSTVTPRLLLLKSEYVAASTFEVTSTPANPTVATYKSYDTTFSVKCVLADCTVARLKFNGETVGLVDLDYDTVRVCSVASIPHAQWPCWQGAVFVCVCFVTVVPCRFVIIRLL
jgi:hypothetical protein